MSAYIGAIAENESVKTGYECFARFVISLQLVGDKPYTFESPL